MITIGDTTREIKARLLSINWNENSGNGSVNGQYYYESTVNDEVKIVPVHSFHYPINESPFTSSKADDMLRMAVENTPLP